MVSLHEPLADLIHHPQTFTGGKRFAKKIHIYDETLRDGEQMPGVAFSPTQKVEIAAFLSDLGVDVLLPAFVISSESDREAYQRILQAREEGRIRREIEIITIARSTPGDIEAAASATEEAGVSVDRAGILLLSTTSDLHLKYKLGQTLLKFKGESADQWLSKSVEWYRRANLDHITEHIALARRRGFGSIEFASEDASRGSREYLIEWALACHAAGGTRLCFSDTCGVFTPDGVDHYFPALIEALPNFQITAHFHNDLGLASANTIRALGHGATHASITANGIGERAGNASIHQIVMILKELYGKELPGFRYDKLWELRDLIERYSGIPMQAHEPIIGRNVFSHESGIHTAGVNIHPAIYQFLDEKTVGGIHGFVYGKHSGKAAILHIADRHPEIFAGVPKSALTDAVINAVLADVKRLRDEAIPDEGYRNVIDDYYRHVSSLGVPESTVADLLAQRLLSA